MRRLLKCLFRTLGLPLLIALAVCNGYVHQPRHWQQARAQQLPAPLADWITRVGNATADTTDALGLTGHDLTATPTRLWPTGFIGACKLLYERFRTYD